MVVCYVTVKAITHLPTVSERHITDLDILWLHFDEVHQRVSSVGYTTCHVGAVFGF
uniref:Uncharacterized protein n=1 Tax=Candidatus Methanogaster sp. ANME-2c ERB4 TaxID=2759911 RepID=A0A7G9YQW1_9EURY|nr:hypothetical protein CKJHOKLD_00016 [Methanosarcinales archaeon ANME-2c ERB4]